MEKSRFAVKLKELRQERNMSRQDLAVAAGLSMSVVTQLEQGYKTSPQAETIWKLSRALGITMDDLYVPEDEPAEEKPAKKKGK